MTQVALNVLLYELINVIINVSKKNIITEVKVYFKVSGCIRIKMLQMHRVEFNFGSLFSLSHSSPPVPADFCI